MSEMTKPWDEWIREHDDPKYAWKKPEALDDIWVIDLSYANMAGCFASSILAEMGANVIRIEPPGGDPARTFTPFGITHKGEGLGYLNEGRNKFHITLNLETEKGRELFKKLANKVDVIIETFLPGTMDEWGIGYRQLREDNPGLIYCAIYTYGQYGPKAGCGKPDVDVIDQAMSGITYVSGEYVEDPNDPKEWEVPTKQGNWMGWYCGGAYAAFAILVALHYRHNTGEGQMIDLSPAEAYGRMINYSLTYFYGRGETVERVGNLDAGVFCYTYFKCKDGYCFLSGFSDVNWSLLTEVIERPDLREKYPTIFERLKFENMKEAYKEIEKWTLDKEYKEIYEKVMQANKEAKESGKGGVVVPGKVCSAWEAMHTENWWIRGTFEKFNDPIYGELVICNQPWKMTETPPRVKWVCRPVGRDNEYIYLTFLNIGKEELAELKEENVV